MNPATVLDFVNLFFAGMLAGIEFVIHYGLRGPSEMLDDHAQLQLRQALVLRLRVLTNERTDFLGEMIVINGDLHRHHSVDRGKEQYEAGQRESAPRRRNFLAPKIFKADQGSAAEHRHCGAAHKVVMPMRQHQMSEDQRREECRQ